jgi:hypothetical protein
VEEERDGVISGRGSEGGVDGVVLGHGNGMEVVEVAAAWTRRH